MAASLRSAAPNDPRLIDAIGTCGTDATTHVRMATKHIAPPKILLDMFSCLLVVIKSNLLQYMFFGGVVSEWRSGRSRS